MQQSSGSSILEPLDRLMSSSPWYPRVLPFATYLVLLIPVQALGDAQPWTYPLFYALQIAIVSGMMWRYRRLTPELNVRFHWLAVPTGIALLFAWVYLGYFTIWVTGGSLGPTLSVTGTPVPTMLEEMRDQSLALFWASMILRFVGMSVVVPLFEEMWTRDVVLRAFHDARRSGVGFLQFLADMPVVGEWIERSPAGQRALQQPPVFTQQLLSTPVGAITVFSVVISTLVFMLSHVPRDYLGCVACGVVWCWLVWYTNRSRAWRDRPLGLGPIVWSHGITNAGLWIWTLVVGDWQFL